MIWFGNLNRILAVADPEAFGPLSEERRMQRALEAVAEQAPLLSGDLLLDALAATGWVDRSTAKRLMPAFRHFDADRHFADYLRRLSFRGRSAEIEFRRGIRCVFQDLLGDGSVDPDEAGELLRFRRGDYEGVVLAHPEVSFSIGGPTRDRIQAAREQLPDALVVVARNFDGQAAAQVSSLLARSEVPGTLVTVNLLLGIRATTLRYQPPLERVMSVLAAGGTLRSRDIARLGDRV